jgi:hypothetical protein
VRVVPHMVAFSFALVAALFCVPSACYVVCVRASFARYRVGFAAVMLSACVARGVRARSRAVVLFHALRISCCSANSSRLESLMLFKLLI